MTTETLARKMYAGYLEHVRRSAPEGISIAVCVSWERIGPQYQAIYRSVARAAAASLGVRLEDDGPADTGYAGGE